MKTQIKATQIQFNIANIFTFLLTTCFAFLNFLPYSSQHTFSSLAYVTSFASASYVETRTPFATFGFTKTTLLSGGLTSCDPSPNVPDCSGGIASALFVHRNETARLQSQNSEFIYFFDRDTAFVQMHPLDYTVNIELMRTFGVNYYFAEPSIIPNRNNRKAFDLFYNDDVRMLLANQNIDADDDWFGFIERQVTLFNDTVGVFVLGQSIFASAMPSYRVLPSVMRYLRLRKGVKAVMMVQNDASTTADELLAYVNTLGNNDLLMPDVVLDLLSTTSGSATAQPCRYAYNSRVQICDSPGSWSDVNLVHLYMDATNSSSLSTSAPAGGGSVAYVSPYNVRAQVSTTTVNGLAGDPSLDARYYADQAVLLTEARKAAAYNPVVGNATTTAMPSGGFWDNTYPCFVGECGQATLNGRALLDNDPSADIAISNSGAYRGTGWTVGNIRMSSIWEMLPYSDNLVSLKVLGLKVWQIMNISMYYFPGEDRFTSVNERFLQGEGFQVEYDASKPQFTDRLLSVKIRNRQTGVYEPLERLKYYTIATDTFMYGIMPMYSTIFQSLYEGESSIVPYSTSIRQEVMAQYLMTHSPYNDIYNEQLKPVTDAAQSGRRAMDWTQTSASCDTIYGVHSSGRSNSYWSSGLASCMACGAGFVANQAGDGCDTAPPESRNYSTLIAAIAAPVGSIVFLLVVTWIAFGEYKRRKNARNLDHAPKTGDEITIIFTDIQSSTKLWATVPASMAEAIELHHKIIRGCIDKYEAYEVKTVGDSFMIACKSVERAVLLTIAIQEGLYMSPLWPRSINDVYRCAGLPNEADLLDGIDDDPLVTVSQSQKGDGSGPSHAGTSYLSDPFNGVRVRIGFNCGPADAVFDEVTKAYDYYGNAVNVAARIEAAAQGGQILTNRATSDIIAERMFASGNPASNDLFPYTIEFYLSASLQGLQGLTELFQINPTAAAGAGAPSKYRGQRKASKVGDGGRPMSTANQSVSTRPSVCGIAARRFNPKNIAEKAFADGKVVDLLGSGNHTTNSQGTRATLVSGTNLNVTNVEVFSNKGFDAAEKTSLDAQSLRDGEEDGQESQHNNPLRRGQSSVVPLSTQLTVDDELLQSLCRISITTSLKLLSNDSRMEVLRTLAKSWRVQFGGGRTSGDQTHIVSLIAMRIIPSLKRHVFRVGNENADRK